MKLNISGRMFIRMWFSKKNKINYIFYKKRNRLTVICIRLEAEMMDLIQQHPPQTGVAQRLQLEPFFVLPASNKTHASISRTTGTRNAQCKHPVLISSQKYFEKQICEFCISPAKENKVKVIKSKRSM